MSTISINATMSERLPERRRRRAPLSQSVTERRREIAQYVAAAVVVLWIAGTLMLVMKLLTPN